MKEIALYFLAVLLFASCNTKKPTEEKEKNEKTEFKTYTIEQFYKNVSIGGGSFSFDDSKLLVMSNKTGIYNVYALAVDGSGEEQLTNSTEESCFAIAYFPEDMRVLFSSDKGGNENDQIFMRDTNGTVKNLTPTKNTVNRFMGWSRDNKSLYFTSNKRDKRFFDLYEMKIDAVMDSIPETEMLFENEQGLNIASISKNKRYLALTRSITTSNNEMYLYDRETKEMKNISEHTGDATFSPQFFDIDNANLYSLSNENAEFTYVMKFNLESGTKEKVYETNWNVWYAYHSYNEKYRVIGINEDGKTVVHLIELKTGKEVDLPKIEGSSIKAVRISRSEKLMRLTIGTSASPNNIYTYNIETKELKKLTNTLNPEIEAKDLVEGEVIRYKSYDGTEIPSIYYKPHQATAENKVPALIWVHGGPGGQSRLSYFPLVQYLVNHGYAVLAVNNRGSSGYGKTFYQMDDRKHGDADLKDCIEAKKFLKSKNYIDSNKIGIIGGSYGGYMVMAALTFAPEEFAVGVDIFGVTNWLRTLKSMPPHWEAFRKALFAEMGDPTTEDSVRLYNISPVFHAENITKPLMVLQGANDIRVLQVESDEIVEAARKNGVPVEYMVFDDEGHGFLKKENEIKGYGKVLEFLNKHLKNQNKQ